MTRRKFSSELTFEAEMLVTDRGVAVAKVARGVDVAESVMHC